MNLNNFTGYFDWAATAVPDTELLRDALELSLSAFGNPSSTHRAGIQAQELLTKARERCAAVLGVKPQTIIFTSGGTEANHLPILSLLQRPAKGSIAVSAIEHPAIREQVHMMKNCGWKVISIQSDENGIIQPEEVIRTILPDTALACVMAVNNETGAIQPIADIAHAIAIQCAGKKKPIFHVDAVQAAGKIPLNLHYCGIDCAAISAHKMCGPRGIGLLYVARRHEPFIRGGAQEGGLRPGTENLFGALALASCLEKYAEKKTLTAQIAQAQEQCTYFIEQLVKIRGCSIIPQNRAKNEQPKIASFSPWIVQVSFEKIPGNVLVRALSEKGFCISTGSACTARKLNRPVLEAMRISKEEAANAVRFSFGYTTERANIDNLLSALNEITKLFYSV